MDRLHSLPRLRTRGRNDVRCRFDEHPHRSDREVCYVPYPDLRIQLPVGSFNMWQESISEGNELFRADGEHINFTTTPFVDAEGAHQVIVGFSAIVECVFVTFKTSKGFTEVPPHRDTTWISLRVSDINSRRAK